MMFFLAFAILLAPATPEEFLIELGRNSSGVRGAEYWSESASGEVQERLTDPDSLLGLLQFMSQLSVDPGPRTAFIEQEGSFRVEFGESQWTWANADGQLSMKKGLSVVIVTDGEYSWAELPVLERGSFNIGTRERLISGIMLTFLFMVVAGVLLAWARRRYL